MKIISIHSHKGGAGKTTIALFLAKAFAMKDQKVCAIDLDFVGSGFEDIVKLKKAEKTINDYLFNAREENIPIRDIISTYTDKDLNSQEIHLILNTSRNSNSDLKEQALWYGGHETNLGLIEKNVSILLKELSAMDYDLCLLDCHPGLYEVSLSLLDIFRKERTFRFSLSLFVTTTNQAHLLGLLHEINWLGIEKETSKRVLDSKHSMIVINRTDKSISWTSIIRAIKDSWAYGGSTLVNTLEDAGFFLNRQIIKDTPQLLSYADVYSDGIIPNIEGVNDIRELRKKIWTILSL